MAAKKKAVSKRAAIRKKNDQELQRYLSYCFRRQLEYFESLPEKSDYDAWLCYLIVIGFRLYGEQLSHWPFKIEVLTGIHDFIKLKRIGVQKDLSTFGLRLSFRDSDGDLAIVESHFQGLPLIDDTPQLKDKFKGIRFGPRKLFRRRVVGI